MAGRGRPEIGGMVTVRLGDLLPAVEKFAEQNKLKRSAAVRRLVEIGLSNLGKMADEGQT